MCVVAAALYLTLNALDGTGLHFCHTSARMQRLWNKYMIGDGACRLQTTQGDTSQVDLGPVSGLWAIYGAAVGLACVLTGAAVALRARRSPDKNAEARERARVLSRQVSAAAARSLSTARQIGPGLQPSFSRRGASGRSVASTYTPAASRESSQLGGLGARHDACSGAEFARMPLRVLCASCFWLSQSDVLCLTGHKSTQMASGTMRQPFHGAIHMLRTAGQLNVSLVPRRR
jgi:hypothetical protein